MSINIFIRYIGKFVFFVLLQVILLNKIQISSLGITPYVYVLFILLLPFETPGWLILIFGFVTGLSVDAFDDTGGAHAAATVFIAFIRPTLLNAFSPREGYEYGKSPRIFHYGFNWFLKYLLTLLFIHHLVFFFIEVFSFSNFFMTIFRVILTLVFSSALIILSQFLIFRK